MRLGLAKRHQWHAGLSHALPDSRPGVSRREGVERIEARHGKISRRWCGLDDYSFSLQHLCYIFHAGIGQNRAVDVESRTHALSRCGVELFSVCRIGRHILDLVRNVQFVQKAHDGS